jgi:integrase
MFYEYNRPGERKPVEIPLGRLLALPDAEKARSEAIRFHHMRRAGVDPKTEVDKEAAREASARNVAQVLAGYMTKPAFKAKSLSTRRATASSFRRHVLPNLADDDAATLKAERVYNTMRLVVEATPSELVTVYRMAQAFDAMRVDATAIRTARRQLKAHMGDAPEVDHHDEVAQAGLLGFYATLKAIDTPPAKCLQLIALTGGRLNEIRGLRWSEMAETPAGLVWALPATAGEGRNKAKRDVVRPLSAAAAAILATIPKDGAEVFPNVTGKAVSRLMERLAKPATVHGLRSSMRTAMAERHAPREISEMMLGHVFGSAAERSYKRTALLPDQRKWFEVWAGVLEGETAPDNVLEIKRAI